MNYGFIGINQAAYLANVSWWHHDIEDLKTTLQSQTPTLNHKAAVKQLMVDGSRIKYAGEEGNFFAGTTAEDTITSGLIQLNELERKIIAETMH